MTYHDQWHAWNTALAQHWGRVDAKAWLTVVPEIPAAPGEKTMTMIRNYDTNETLPGEPSPELIRESAQEGSGTGAVPAYRDANGVWQYVRPSEKEYYRHNLLEDVITVYVES